MSASFSCVMQNEVDNPAKLASSVGEDHRGWYAVYTLSRHERQVAIHAESVGVDCFFPAYKSVRRWKDRRKEMEFALFPSYVFVHIGLPERLQVLRLPGVVQLVTFNGRPAKLPDAEIERLRVGAASHTSLYPHPYIKAGKKVRVRSGPMAGVEGLLVRRRGTCRVVVSIDLIMRSVAAEVDEADIEPLS